MTPFTDDNLAELKERKSSHEAYRIIELMGVELDSLLARLDAAERVCRAAHMVDEETMKAWRKAAGK